MIEQLTLFYQRWLVPSFNYSDPLEAQRARSLTTILGIGSVFAVFGAIISALGLVFGGGELGLITILVLVSPILAFILYRLVNSGQYRPAVLIIWLTSLILTLTTMQNGINDLDTIACVFPIIIAGILMGWRITIASIVVQLVVAAQVTFFQRTSAGVAPETDAFLLLAVILVVVALWIIIFGSNVQVSATRFINELETLRRVASISSSSQVGQNEATLSVSTINLLRDQLNYTYAQVFTVTEDGKLYQRIASGLDMRQVNIDNAENYSNANGLYEAIRSRKTVQIGTYSADIRRAHLLPGVKTALEVPLINSQNQVIGVLDVQQESDRVFSRSEVEIIELLARQLANNIGQSRLTTQLQETLAEQTELVKSQKERLLNYERSEFETTTSAWTSYLEQRGIDYLGFDIRENDQAPVPASKITPMLEPALKTGEISLQDGEDYQIVSVPVILRGQTLGAMSFKVPHGSQNIGPRQLDLIRSVVQRLGLALENKRLFEQSQSQAKRESRANQVGSLLLSTTDIETVLRLAVDNFNEALGAVQTRIHLQPDAQVATEETE